VTFQTVPFFPHRRNKDGTFNSNCLEYFATVASNMTEVELVHQDKNHVCAKIDALETRQSRIFDSR